MLVKGNKINVKYVHEEETVTASMQPVKKKKSGEEGYKLGLWVRDAAEAGVGTLTFYEPETKMFATLGHGILDVDTLELIKIAKWRIGYYEYFKHSKGEKGKPGEIRGTIESGYTLGRITKILPLGFMAC